MMYETEEQILKAVLIGVDTGAYLVERSMDELAQLVKTAGAFVVGSMVQKRPSYDSATYVGRGFLEQLAQYCDAHSVDFAVVDTELTNTQYENMQNALGVPVLDRTALILDIFALHAKSREGKLQVALAQYAYKLSHLAGMGNALSRLGGGIGTRGPGETKLETDRRHIRRRIKALQEELQELKKRRERLRERRKKDGVFTVALVGYTNAGKSTLLNCLTGAAALAQDKLFATLDPLSRKMILPNQTEVLLIDTVGLLQRLPHQLVAAFRSTLEEFTQADLLLHVVDASDPYAKEQMEVAQALLAELGAGGINTLVVFNKADKLDFLPKNTDSCYYVSAKSGFGMEDLLKKIEQTLYQGMKRRKILLPYEKSAQVSELQRQGRVQQIEYLPEGILLDVYAYPGEFTNQERGE